MEEEMESRFEDDEEDAADDSEEQCEQSNRYGSVPGLDDGELAEPEELERQIVLQEWGPVLSLPTQGKRSWLRGTMDETGRLDFGAFATVDFERHAPSFDRARYKADKLHEQLKDVLILFSIVSDRINTGAKYLVLKYLKMGILGLEQIASEDMRALGRLYLRAKRLQQEIAELREASAQRRQRRAQVLVRSW